MPERIIYRRLDEEGVSKERWRNVIAFWVCGLLNNFAYVVMLSAALALLKDENLSPGIVLLADIVPGLVTQACGPMFMFRFSYRIRVAFVVLTAVASFLITGFCQPLGLRLFGVVCASVSSAFGEITFLAYSSRFHKDCVSWWSSGTGAAGILGSFFYFGLIYALSDSTTLLVCSPLPVGMAVAYWIIVEPPVPIEVVDTRPGTPSVDGVPPRLPSLITKPSLHVSGSVHVTQPNFGPKLSINAMAPVTLPSNSEPILERRHSDDQAVIKLSARQKLRLIWQLCPFMLPLAIVYFAEYLINQAIDPVMTFPADQNFGGKEYVVYQAIYQMGVFLSRSSVKILPLRKQWMLSIPAIFQIINAVFFTLVAVYNFVGTIWVIFVIVLWEGLMGGTIYVNAFYQISQRFSGAEKEFCLGSTSMSYAASITLAAALGTPYTPFLQQQRALHGHVS